ncbi:MAG: hypothetical protein DSO07_07220 [Thermoproteota archaeon]|uniref:Uncharacterized protein n=1 Tax=Candidatus Methanodesulfokora washburnensis TaxID=2478471 RepID=A0A3R9PBK4_9CREN|nr:hypothetical protein [Candidatus Methanodesulfokores washburnensis]RSN71634.1 hypothetical protein D6D85_15610 [Candidatus Methanodesulfokores washburnensis]TDA40918.1 MAG: hypothetical protein DSO07_07220 [Candidatus Korarchaeota archaeon]
MRLVLSLPNSDRATAIWTNEMLKDIYINKLKEKYDVVTLVGGAAVAQNWWQYNDPNTVYAGVGHGNFFIYTGQNMSTIMTNSDDDIRRFNAAAFCPASCLVWNGKTSICQKLAEKGVPIVIGEETEYALTDFGVKYYVSAEVNILYNLQNVYTYDDLRKLIDSSYDEQIQAAEKAGDYFDAGILKDDKIHRLCALNKPIGQPPQPTESYITLYYRDSAGYPITDVKVTCVELNITNDTDGYDWTVFRVPFGRTYTFISEKEGYWDAHTSVKADQDKIIVTVFMVKKEQPPPPSPPPPQPQQIEGEFEGELTGVAQGAVWIGKFHLNTTMRMDGVKMKGVIKGKITQRK